MALFTARRASQAARDGYEAEATGVRMPNALKVLRRVFPTRSFLWCVAMSGLLFIGTSEAQLLYKGVNLAGAEFGEGNLPGNYNSDYTYPSSAEVDYYMDKGMNTFRVPFRWERLQQSQFASLNGAELNRLTNFVDYATGQGAQVILDPHNYARYYGDLIGSSSVPYSAFDDFWSRVANEFKSNSNVGFGIVNEPHTMPTEQWATAAQSAINSIRATGSQNLILVPGNGWTGAHSWLQNWYGTPNGTAMLGITDPANNFMFEVHQYLDSDSSGTSAQIVSPTIGQERLVNFTNWLRTHDRRGFLGEFAVANSTIGAGIGDEAIDNMLNYLKANDDVWEGWTWWAGGPWWGDYLFTSEPTNLGQPNEADRPVITALGPHLIPTIDADFDDDGSIDGTDIDDLVAAIVAGANDPDFDLTENGTVDNADLNEWLAQAGAANLPSGNPYLIGDANLTGVVDAVDFAIWSANKFTTNPAWTAGDFSANGTIDAVDFALWSQNKFQSSGSAAASVPEPSAALLLITVFACLGTARKR